MPVSRRVVTGGLLAGLAALFQLSAGFLPGPGHVLSMFGTLPIYLLAQFSAVGGCVGLLAATAVVALFQPFEAPILLMMTGPLGLAYSLAERAGWHRIFCVGAAGLALAGGMLLLTYGLGMPAFGDFIGTGRRALTVAGFAIFAVAYAAIWSFVFVRCRRSWPSGGSARARRTGRTG